MTETIRIPCSTSRYNNPNEMWICPGTLMDLFDGNWENKAFTACFKKRTPKSKRPSNALKLHIPGNFVGAGIKYETDSGKWDSSILVVESDRFVRRHELVGGKYWVWIELD